MELEKLKAKIREVIDVKRQELIDLSLRIHANPEVGWKEEKASRWLADYLEKNGFEVERGICDLPTSFRASYGEGKPVIAFLCEYDALPDIGHGCGHNIIGSAGVGAGIAAKSFVDQFGATILVMGCPAEELLGGKVIMVEKGAFDDVDVAMIMHPSVEGKNWLGSRTAANIFLDVEFWGKEAHAAVDPWSGTSALEALILAFNNINGLRLHVKDRGRISGIITDGGKAANVIPGHAAGIFMVRSPEDKYLGELREKVLKCFEGAALATGVRLEYRWGMKCDAMQDNSTLLQLWKKNLEILGRKVDEVWENSGTLDMGNVSVFVPSIQTYLSISSGPVPFHSNELAAAAISDAGKQAVVDGAKALAMTALDVMARPEALSLAKEELAETRKQKGIL